MKKILLSFALSLLGTSLQAAPIHGIHFMSCDINHPYGDKMLYTEFANIEKLNLDNTMTDDDFFVPAQKMIEYSERYLNLENCKVYLYDQALEEEQEVSDDYIFTYPQKFALQKSEFRIVNSKKIMCIIKGTKKK